MSYDNNYKIERESGHFIQQVIKIFLVFTKSIILYLSACNGLSMVSNFYGSSQIIALFLYDFGTSSSH